MVMSKQDRTEKLDAILRKAEEFHGHLGPFLTLGVRIGLIGIGELKVKRNDEKLRVTAMLKYSVPFSCVVDGIQVATKCTIGNKKLRLRSSSGIAARFELQRGEQVTVAVDPTAFERLKNELLSENVPPEEVRKLAYLLASMPEEELFIIRRR
ncbi:MAG: FmdE family protein [Candidatus Bathyarchaeota archaeon]|nr:FmdE family protein [Candidatus Bathyarchaeota archaeon]MDH5663820.1 FmdE family protein [Candidatus Bathyarchaeota archaeon]